MAPGPSSTMVGAVMLVVVVVVVLVMVVTRGTRVSRHGEQRQHGSNGDQLGQGHGNYFLLG